VTNTCHARALKLLIYKKGEFLAHLINTSFRSR